MPHPFAGVQSATAKYHGENAVALSQASRLAYNEAAESAAFAAESGFPRFRFIDRRKIQCLVMANSSAFVVAFRGPEPGKLQDWMNDLDAQFCPGCFGEVHNVKLCEKNRAANPF